MKIGQRPRRLSKHHLAEHSRHITPSGSKTSSFFIKKHSSAYSFVDIRGFQLWYTPRFVFKLGDDRKKHGKNRIRIISSLSAGWLDWQAEHQIFVPRFCGLHSPFVRRHQDSDKGTAFSPQWLYRPSPGQGNHFSLPWRFPGSRGHLLLWSLYHMTWLPGQISGYLRGKMAKRRRCIVPDMVGHPSVPRNTQCFHRWWKAVIHPVSAQRGLNQTVRQEDIWFQDAAFWPYGRRTSILLLLYPV